MSVRRVKTTSGTYFTLALPLGWSARAGAPRPSSPLRVSRKRMTALIGSIPDQMGPCEAESEHAREREHQRCHLTRASASGYKRRQGALLMAVKKSQGETWWFVAGPQRPSAGIKPYASLCVYS